MAVQEQCTKQCRSCTYLSNWQAKLYFWLLFLYWLCFCAVTKPEFKLAAAPIAGQFFSQAVCYTLINNKITWFCVTYHFHFNFTCLTRICYCFAGEIHPSLSSESEMVQRWTKWMWGHSVASASVLSFLWASPSNWFSPSTILLWLSLLCCG